MNNPILSICIPTYNREKFIRENLNILKNEIGNLQVELIISDNCSKDNTQDVVRNFIKEGLVCTYIRNKENMGGDLNFVQCFQKATGKYIWLLGDDDYLTKGSLKPIVEYLESHEVGMFHIDNNSQNFDKNGFESFNSIGNFFSDISVLITFMSVNIIRKNIVEKVNYKDFVGSFLIQVVYYTMSAASGYDNVIYHSKVLTTGADGANNGGYNYFVVFVRNLLDIYYVPVKEGLMDIAEYEYVKKSIFKEFVSEYTIDLLILNKPSKLQKDGAWGILFRNYGKNLYFYTIMTKKIFNRFKGCLTV